MEEFLLGGFLARDELDVVHEEHVRLAVPLVELRGGAVADGFDQLVGEFVAFDVDDVHLRMPSCDLVADGIEQVGFPEAGIAVDEQRVVERRRLCGDRHGSRMRKFVRRPHDERVEGELVVVVLGRGVLFLLLLRGGHVLRHADLHLDARPEDLGHRVVQKIHIAPVQRLPVEFIRRLQKGDPLCKVQADRLNPADPGGVSHLGDVFFAVFANKTPGFGKRFHV